MAYIDPYDLARRYGESQVHNLADRDRDGTPDSRVISEAIDRAEASIDAAIGVHYETPVRNEPALSMLRGFAMVLAFADLYGIATPEPLQKEVERIHKELVAISKGERKLDGAFLKDEETPKADRQKMRLPKAKPAEIIFTKEKLNRYTNGR